MPGRKRRWSNRYCPAYSVPVRRRARRKICSEPRCDDMQHGLVHGDFSQGATLQPLPDEPAVQIGRPVRVHGMRWEGHGWDRKGPASIHRARAALDRDDALIRYVFESKGLSRTSRALSEAGELDPPGRRSHRQRRLRRVRRAPVPRPADPGAAQARSGVTVERCGQFSRPAAEGRWMLAVIVFGCCSARPWRGARGIPLTALRHWHRCSAQRSPLRSGIG